MLCVAQRFVTFLDIPAPILKVPQFRLLFRTLTPQAWPFAPTSMKQCLKEPLWNV